MTAAEIAAALGGAHRSGAWWRSRCPTHGSRGATLALRDGGRGLIVHCHAGCQPRDVLAELRRRGLIDGNFLASPSRPIPRGTDPAGDRARRIEAARRIWDTARDARGSPVAAYLAGRGITITPPATLRYAPALRHPDGTRGPAMIARIDSLDADLIGISRTWLDRDATGQWHRCDRAMLGGAAGGVVRLAPAAEVLMLAEGVETAMAAMTATMMPAWAALSTSGLMTLALPPIVATVVILADHDVSGAGERAARTSAARWLREGRRVRIALPPEPGSDFNDVLAGRTCARIAEARDVAA